MKGFLILLVTAIVVCVGNRTRGVHKHRHGKTGHKPERDTGSITLKPGTAKNKLFPGYGTNFRYVGEVKNGLDRVMVVTSIPIPKYSDIEIRPIVFNNCTEDLWRHGARTRGYPQYETYDKCNRVLAQARFYQSQQEELQFLLRQLLNHDLYSVLPELNQTPSMYKYEPSYNNKPTNWPDQHKTKLTAQAVNDTAQVRGRRGFGSILAKAIPGLITLAMESVSSYIKGRQQQRINTAVEELRSDDNKIKNDLKQPGTSGQMSPRPKKYVSLESIALQLLSIEYDFLRELSHLIQTPEHAYGLVCMTTLPDETYVFIRREHTHFGLSVKEIQSRIAFHVLCIWYIQAKHKFYVIPMLKDMFHDLELADDCDEVIDKFPSVVDKLKTNADKAETNKIKMRTKSLGKGKNSIVN